jgi:hypothetical protein
MHLHPLLAQAESFLPHGYCYLWRPGVLGLHLVSDSIITLSYWRASAARAATALPASGRRRSLGDP